jgi:hypothetical protein
MRAGTCFTPLRQRREPKAISSIQTTTKNGTSPSSSAGKCPPLFRNVISYLSGGGFAG